MTAQCHYMITCFFVDYHHATQIPQQNHWQQNVDVRFSSEGIPLHASLSKVLPTDCQHVASFLETFQSLAGQSLLSELFRMLSGDIQDWVHILLALLNEESMLSGTLNFEVETTLSQMAELLTRWVLSPSEKSMCYLELLTSSSV